MAFDFIYFLNFKTFPRSEKISSMQLCLSHLVDLSLGRPEMMRGENFNFLHTLLHVLLKKINLSDFSVELTDEHAIKAQGILNELPKDTSVCLREVNSHKFLKI